MASHHLLASMRQRGTKDAGTDTLSKYDSSASVDERDLKEGERRRSGQTLEKKEEEE